jgi:dolichol-phosphate mannosyltransferase
MRTGTPRFWARIAGDGDVIEDGCPDVPLVSVVVPAMNEAGCLPKLHDELRRVCDGLGFRFEFVVVDDGSTDETPDVLARLRADDPRVRYLLLSRNFGHQAALSAGLAHAAGDAVVMMDGDLQHPPALIPDLLKHWRAGYDVVNTIRRDPAEVGPLKRWLSLAFYKAFNWLANVEIQPGAADFRLLSRPVLDVLNRLPERPRFLRGLVPWLGFQQTYVEFTAPPRWAGRPKYTFARSLRLALEGITSFSYYPLRRLAVFGWFVMIAGMLYGFWAAVAHVFLNATVTGWTSLMVCVLFFGGVQLVALGVIGEYVGVILGQVKSRPLYIVRKAVGTPPAPAGDGQAAVADHAPADGRGA